MQAVYKGDKCNTGDRIDRNKQWMTSTNATLTPPSRKQMSAGVQLLHTNLEMHIQNCNALQFPYSCLAVQVHNVEMYRHIHVQKRRMYLSSASCQKSDPMLANRQCSGSVARHLSEQSNTTTRIMILMQGWLLSSCRGHLQQFWRSLELEGWRWAAFNSEAWRCSIFGA